MQKKAIVNAISAISYILLVVGWMQWVGNVAPKEDTFLAPVAFISLFTLSAAVMAFLFGYAPLQLILENKKKQAASILLQTIMCFGAITAVVIILVTSGW